MSFNSYMSILSRMKSFISKPLSCNNFLRSFRDFKSESDIVLTGKVTIHINNITIDINSDNDVSISGIRFLDIKSDTVFINSDESEKLKQIKLKDHDGLRKKFEMNISRLKSLKDKYETSEKTNEHL